MAAPTVTTINPNTGSTKGGYLVTITGTRFGTDPNNKPVVTFGGTGATQVAVVGDLFTATFIFSQTSAPPNPLDSNYRVRSHAPVPSPAAAVPR